MSRTTRFTSPDGTEWAVDIVLPGASNAMIMFRHPDGRTSGLDRYNWVLSRGPEARSVTSRLSPDKVLAALRSSDIATLFRRSMPVTRADQHAPPRAEAVMSRAR